VENDASRFYELQNSDAADEPDEDNVDKDARIMSHLKDTDLQTAMRDWAEESSSSESEEAPEEDDPADLLTEVVEAPVAIQSGDETKRIAVVGLDWDQLRAVDILVLLRSFCPSNGQVTTVSVYPSEFGKERMKDEAVQGPGKFLAGSEPSGQATGEDFDAEQLRRYELDKLKYYYAVATMDSVRTAIAIYSLCDGLEYRDSANVLDLRFIPDEMTFDDAPRDSADSVPVDYEPPYFQTKALQASNVELTWDRDDPIREKVFKSAKGDKVDYTRFIASSESEDDEDDRAKCDQLLALARSQLNSTKEAEEQRDVNVTFHSALSDKAEQLLQEKAKGKQRSKETPWDKYQRTRKEKKNKDQKEQEPASASFDDPFFQQDADFGLDVWMWMTVTCSR